MKHIKNFKIFEAESMENLEMGKVYKIYDIPNGRKLWKGAAKFDKKDAKGYTFHSVNLPNGEPFVIANKDIANYSFTEINWKDDYKKKK